MGWEWDWDRLGNDYWSNANGTTAPPSVSYAFCPMLFGSAKHRSTIKSSTYGVLKEYLSRMTQLVFMVKFGKIKIYMQV